MGKSKRKRKRRAKDVDISDVMSSVRQKNRNTSATSLFFEDTDVVRSVPKRTAARRAARERALHVDAVFNSTIAPLGAEKERVGNSVVRAKREAKRKRQRAIKEAKRNRPSTYEQKKVEILAERIKSGALEAPSKRRAKRKARIAKVCGRRTKGTVVRPAFEGKERVLHGDQHNATRMDEMYDLWADDAPLVDVDSDDDYVTPTVLHMAPPPPKRRKIREAEGGMVAPVEIPDAGKSYRPDTEEHQQVLGALVADALQEQWEKEELDAKLSHADMRNILRSSTHLTALDMHGAPEAAAEPGNQPAPMDEDSESSSTPLPIAKPVTHRKTKAERNRERKHKLRMMRQRNKKAAKKRAAQERAAKQIAKQVDRDLKRQEEKRKMREAIIANAKMQPKRKIGKNAYGEDKTEFLLTEQLPDQLRSLKVPSSLLQDRLYSYEKRHVIDVARRQRGRRKSNTKQYWKHHVKRNLDGTSLQVGPQGK